MSYCLAIDIGASSGRHLLGELKNGRLETTEIYRFENGMKEQNGSLTWDIAALTEHVIAGIAKCRTLGKIPATVSIDTWGVDYVLLDGEDGLFHNAQHSAAAEGTVVFGQRNGLVSLVMGYQAACALLLDVNIAVDYEDTNFANLYGVTLLHKHLIAIVEGRLHAVAANGNDEVGLLRRFAFGNQ